MTDPPQKEIIRVDPATGAQTIISSGNNLIYPTGITIDAAGNLLVADRTAHAVIRIDPKTGAQAVVSAGGNLNGDIGAGPNGIAVDAAGNLLVANSRGGFNTTATLRSVVPPLGSVIVRVDPITGAQAVVSEGGALTSLNGIAIDVAGNLLVVSGDSRIIARNGDDRDGRTYTINVTARDQVGDVGSCSAVVTVLHNQGQ